MITDMNYYKKVAKRLFVFIFTLVALYIAFKLSLFYIPFLIAFIISLIIEPLIRKVMKITNLTRKVSAIITLVVVFSIIIGLLIWGITGTITEASGILYNLNDNMENITSTISSFIEIFKFLFLKNLGMKCCNTVNGKSCNYCKICHLNLTVIYNCHFGNFILIARILYFNLCNKSSVDFLHNLVNTRKQS